MLLSVILLVITYHVIMYNVTAFNQFWRQNKSEGETDEKVCQRLD